MTVFMKRVAIYSKKERKIDTPQTTCTDEMSGYVTLKKAADIIIAYIQGQWYV
jgi:hypothetical protein